MPALNLRQLHDGESDHTKPFSPFTKAQLTLQTWPPVRKHWALLSCYTIIFFLKKRNNMMFP